MLSRCPAPTFYQCLCSMDIHSKYAVSHSQSDGRSSYLVDTRDREVPAEFDLSCRQTVLKAADVMTVHCCLVKQLWLCRRSAGAHICMWGSAGLAHDC